MVRDLYTNEISSLHEGKADFLLCASVTKTCEIEGITQAGIPGFIPLTPVLDAEFISSAKVYSMPNLAETPKGVPTPALLTRAVHELSSFSQILTLDLGLEVKPQNTKLIDFDIFSSPDITTNESFNIKTVFQKAINYGSSYERVGEYIILGESTPSGTTTAQTSAMVLDVDVKDAFASSFKNSPKSIKDEVISKAMSKITPQMSILDKLSLVSDNTLIFVAGFLVGASKNHKIVLAGGTQMASALLVVSKMCEELNCDLAWENISLCTTAWIAKDRSSNIVKLLNQLPQKVDAHYADFSYEDANIHVLKLYDEGEAKEGVGAGAAIAYGFTNGLSQKDITAKVEELMMAMVK